MTDDFSALEALVIGKRRDELISVLTVELTKARNSIGQNEEMILPELKSLKHLLIHLIEKDIFTDFKSLSAVYAFYEDVIARWSASLTSGEARELIDYFFLAVNPHAALMRLVKSLSQQRNGNNRLSSEAAILLHSQQQILRILQELLRSPRLYKELFSLGAGESNLTKSKTLQDVVQIFVSVPDRVAGIQGKDPFFLPSNYFKEILEKVLGHSRDFGSSDLPPVLTLLFDKLARLGEDKIAASELIRHMTSHRGLGANSTPSDSNQIDWASLTAVLSGMSLNGAERLCYSLIESLAERNEATVGTLSSLFGSLIVSSPNFRFLFTSKFLSGIFPFRLFLRILDMLFELQSKQRIKSGAEGVFHGAISQLLDSWSAPNFIHHASVERHRDYSMALVHCFNHKMLLSTDLEGGLLPKFLSAVESHLELPVQDKRILGMRVAQALSTVMSPENPLVFEGIEGLEALDAFLEREERNNDGMEQVELTTTATSTTPVKATVRTNGEDLAAEKKQQPVEKKKVFRKGKPRALQAEKEFDPDRPFFQTFSDSDDSTSDESDSDSSSDDDLKPYNLEDDLADSDKTKAPRYIRECLDGLRSDEPELIGATLDVLESVINRSEGDLPEVALILVEVLFNLGNQYNLPRFDTLKQSNLVLLTAQAVEHVVPYFVTQILHTVTSLNQRITAISVLVEAAQLLAKGDKNDTKGSSATAQPKVQQVKQLSQGNTSKSLVDQRIESNTRRWGNTLSNRSDLKPSQTTFVNKFALKANYFFQLLLQLRFLDASAHRYTFALFGADGHVLGRLLHAYGVFAECSGFSCDCREYLHDLIRLILFTRYHSQSYVRMASLVALSKIPKAMDTSILFSDEFIEEMNEIFMWLQSLTEATNNEERLLALSLLSLLQSQWKDLEETLAAKNARESADGSISMLTPMLTQVKTQYY